MSDLRWVVVNEDGQHQWLGRSTEPLQAELARIIPALDDQGIAAWLGILLGEYWFAPSVHVVGVRLVTQRQCPLDTAVVAFQRRRAEVLGGLEQPSLPPTSPNPPETAVWAHLLGDNPAI